MQFTTFRLSSYEYFVLHLLTILYMGRSDITVIFDLHVVGQSEVLYEVKLKLNCNMILPACKWHMLFAADV